VKRSKSEILVILLLSALATPCNRGFATAVAFALAPEEALMVATDSRFLRLTNGIPGADDSACKIFCSSNKFFAIAGLAFTANASFIDIASNASFTSPTLQSALNLYSNSIAWPLRMDSTDTNRTFSPGIAGTSIAFFGVENGRLAVERLDIVFTNGTLATALRTSYKTNGVFFMGDSGRMKAVYSTLPKGDLHKKFIQLISEEASTNAYVGGAIDIMRIYPDGSREWIQKKTNCWCD
jgi:hypothetical protein